MTLSLYPIFVMHNSRITISEKDRYGGLSTSAAYCMLIECVYTLCRIQYIHIIVFLGHFNIPDNVYTLYTVVEAVDFHRNKNWHIVIENSTVRLVELFL